MKLNLALLSASALTIALAVPAFADNNKIYLDQNGTANTGLVIQSDGSNNQFGNTGKETRAFQEGNSNYLYAYQGGNSNSVGVGDVVGFDQKSSNNHAQINQIGDNNKIVKFVQYGRYKQSSDLANYATIYQESSSNTVIAIVQDYDGGSVNTIDIRQFGGNNNSIALAAQKGGGNYLLAVQDGGGNSIGRIEQGLFKGEGYKGLFESEGATADVLQNGNNNEIGWLKQYGGANYALVHQVGDHNKIAGLGQAGDKNSAIVSINGGWNGGTRDFKAGVSTLEAGLIEQLGDGNALALYVTGDQNLFSISQDNKAGDAGNWVLGSVNGNWNQASVIQTGANNAAEFYQTGDYNISSLTQTGTSNWIQVYQ